jgi:hypothetical protein
MNGLRMFIRPANKDSVENNVFYSQRSHGPIYRWRYEKDLATWQSVPHELKAQLNEHYLE